MTFFRNKLKLIRFRCAWHSVSLRRWRLHWRHDDFSYDDNVGANPNRPIHPCCYSNGKYLYRLRVCVCVCALFFVRQVWHVYACFRWIYFRISLMPFACTILSSANKQIRCGSRWYYTSLAEHSVRKSLMGNYSRSSCSLKSMEMRPFIMCDDEIRSSMLNGRNRIK